MDEKTKTAAGIAAGLQGLKYDDKRLAELAAEVEILNDAVRKAAAAAPHLRRRSGGFRQRHGEGGTLVRNDDLALEDLTAIADAIAAGRTTSVAATEACLARIEAWQPRTNAFLRVYKEKALAQAKAMDAELAAGRAPRAAARRADGAQGHVLPQGRALDRRQRDPRATGWRR